MTDYTVATLPLFAKKSAGNDKVRKPDRCQECGCKKFQKIEGRWVCWYCGTPA